MCLRSPPIDLTSATAATLSYFEFRDIEEGFDFGVVLALDPADHSTLAVIAGGIDGLVSDWAQVKTPIPAKALGRNILIEWHLSSDNFQNLAGWYLDDVQVAAGDGELSVNLRFPVHPLATDLVFFIEESENLEDWSVAAGEIVGPDVPTENGSALRTYRLLAPFDPATTPSKYYRLRVDLR